MPLPSRTRQLVRYYFLDVLRTRHTENKRKEMEWGELKLALKPGTFHTGTYRIISCAGRIVHYQYDCSSFIYQAEGIDGRSCLVYEYFPDNWDGLATRDEKQNVLWDYEKILKLRHLVSLTEASPADLLNHIFEDFSRDAKKCQSAYQKGIRLSSCQIACNTFIDNGTCYVILPKLNYQYTLYDYIKKNGIIGARKTAESLVQNCWEDLKYLHIMGITHGAVSPHNIVYYNGRFVLTEFGKPKARCFDSLVNFDGPFSEAAFGVEYDPDSPSWYSRFESEKTADEVGILRTIRFCLTGEWEESAREEEYDRYKRIDLIRCMGCMELYNSRYRVCPYCGYIRGTNSKEIRDLPPGTRLDLHYREPIVVGRVLGYGYCGVTYVGFDYILRQKIALKEFMPVDMSTRFLDQTDVFLWDEREKKTFEIEKSKIIERAEKLKKYRGIPNIVHVFGTFEENNTVYTVMEYCDGESVQSILERQGPLKLREALHIVFEVAEGLRPLHEEGILNLNIAPKNIYRTSDGIVKLVEFSAQQYLNNRNGPGARILSNPGYDPKEVYLNKGKLGPWTDVYALAATFYKMLTGKTPPEFTQRIGKDTLIPPSKMGVIIPENIENALLNAMNIEIEDRTGSLEQFLIELLSKSVKLKAKKHWTLW